MLIERKEYLEKLISKKNNGLIKIITGIRRCGKSYLLFEIYNNYLIESGVDKKNIVKIALDELGNAKYRNPIELDKYIRERIKENNQKTYIFIDEIQLVRSIQNPYIADAKDEIGFVDVLLGLMKIEQLDIYVTGSNSKMLSSDILTEFKDRGDEIRVYPLSYKEFYEATPKEMRADAWREYYNYGGMPMVMRKESHEDKSNYLKGLFSKTYITDVIERNHIANDQTVLEDLLNIISSSVGSLTNPTKLANTFKTKKGISIQPNTISKYLDYFIDAFIIDKTIRYDIKRKRYIETPLKYYFTDIGLRNARMNFRQQEENHIMENIIYNELKMRGFDIDVGMVEYNHKNKENKNVRSQLEIDFVANKVNSRYYIQSALTVSEESKRQQEINSLKRVEDSFTKIVIVKEDIIPWHDENGILYLGIEKFLLDKESIDI